MITNHSVVTPPVSDIHVNTYLLHSIFHRRKRLWAVLVPLVFGGLLAYNLFMVAQIFSSTVSISMQQPAAVASPLGALAGLGGGGKKYNGVIKSRAFAEYVEGKAHLQAMYGMKNHEDIIEYLTKGIKVDDNATDGLMYLSIDLIGPPRMAAGSAVQSAKVKEAAALVANSYATALRNYLVDQDTDRETVLMREAEKQFKALNAVCTAKENQLAAFLKGKGGEKALMAKQTTIPGMASLTSSEISPRSIATASGSNAGEISASGSQLATLLMRRGELETKRASARKADAILTQMLSNPDTLEALPDEDQVLTAARREVSQRRTDLKNLQISFGDSHPSVIAARERLAIAERSLREKITSILRGNTSEHAKLESLNAEYAEVNRQIQEAEVNTKAMRNASTDLQRLQVEVSMWEDARKTLFNKLTEMRTQMVAGQNRIRVVDAALPPSHPKSGLMQAGLTSLIGALLVIVAWLGIEYLLLNSRRYAVAHA